jgi:DNA-binding response OmpR family regulator
MRRARQRVLVVEDDGDLRRMFRTALSLSGFEVLEAPDGIDALQLIEHDQPDLVVLDLTLQRLDGISVQQELAARAITCHIPIVIVTASDADVTGANVACLLRKPVWPDVLVRIVRDCLARGSGAAAVNPL